MRGGHPPKALQDRKLTCHTEFDQRRIQRGRRNTRSQFLGNVSILKTYPSSVHSVFFRFVVSKVFFIESFNTVLHRRPPFAKVHFEDNIRLFDYEVIPRSFREGQSQIYPPTY